MGKRAEQVEATRQRIVDAAVRLHTSVGPARTTVSAIAEEADVTRLTVYRHFPDQEALFAACSAQWDREHPGPDPTAWRAIDGLEARARHALRELYAWYRANHDDLAAILSGVEALPDPVVEEARQQFAAYAEALVARTGVRGRARRRLRSAAGHVVGFWAWRSLAVEQGLDDAEAADLAAALLVVASQGASRPPSAPGS